MMTAGLEAELIARRAAVAAANAHQATCPQCGQPMPGSTPAADPPTSTAKDVLPHAGSITDPTFYDASGDRGVVPVAPDANIANEPPRSGWREKPSQI